MLPEDLGGHQARCHQLTVACPTAFCCFVGTHGGQAACLSLGPAETAICPAQVPSPGEPGGLLTDIPERACSHTGGGAEEQAKAKAPDEMLTVHLTTEQTDFSI